MTNEQKNQLTELAENTEFSTAELPALAAIATAKIMKNPKASIPALQAAALLKYSARKEVGKWKDSGEWSVTALKDTFAFMAEITIE